MRYLWSLNLPKPSASERMATLTLRCPACPCLVPCQHADGNAVASEKTATTPDEVSTTLNRVGRRWADRRRCECSAARPLCVEVELHLGLHIGGQARRGSWQSDAVTDREPSTGAETYIWEYDIAAAIHSNAAAGTGGWGATYRIEP